MFKSVKRFKDKVEEVKEEVKDKAEEVKDKVKEVKDSLVKSLYKEVCEMMLIVCNESHAENSHYLYFSCEIDRIWIHIRL